MQAPVLVASVTDEITATTTVATLSSAIPAGWHAVALWWTGGNRTATIADSVGALTWQTDFQIATGNGSVSIFSAPPTGLANGSTVTATFASELAARALYVFAVPDLATSGWFDGANGQGVAATASIDTLAANMSRDDAIALSIAGENASNVTTVAMNAPAVEVLELATSGPRTSVVSYSVHAKREAVRHTGTFSTATGTVAAGIAVYRAAARTRPNYDDFPKPKLRSA